jgi:hypothetical protein
MMDADAGVCIIITVVVLGCFCAENDHRRREKHVIEVESRVSQSSPCAVN